jgi:hypothetical protein
VAAVLALFAAFVATALLATEPASPLAATFATPTEALVPPPIRPLGVPHLKPSKHPEFMPLGLHEPPRVAPPRVLETVLPVFRAAFVAVAAA